MRSPLLCAAIALGALAAPAVAADPERGLESLRQPVVTGKVATVPGCPNWSDTLTHAQPFEGMSSNYGCATNSNLAAMIADPADLLHGRDDGGPSAEVAVRAVKAWRDTPPTGKNGIEKVTAKGGN